MQYSTGELRERKEPTDTIIRNHAIINGDEDVDLEDVQNLGCSEARWSKVKKQKG
jgi:hypothetical protein